MKYQPPLDGLRALAVIAVVLAHTIAPLAGGGQGVDVFFVLSGYLITTMLLAKPSFGDFIVRRARRLIPALALFLATYVCFAPLFPFNSQDRFVEAALAMGYVQNWLIVFDFRETGLAHTWSLAVEGQFYLLWPLILPVLLKASKPVLILGAMWCLLTVGRIALALHPISMGGEPLHLSYFSTPFHATGLILGAIVALRPPSPKYGPVALAALALVFAFGRGHWPIPVAEVATAFLIPALLVESPLRRAFSWLPAVYVGLISYGIYLWHFPIALALRGEWFAAPATFLAATALAALSYHFVEVRVRRRRGTKLDNSQAAAPFVGPPNAATDQASY